MTARFLLALVVVATLAGCGGSWYVCGEFDMPDYCKVPKTQSAILILNNACPYPVAVGATGSALPAPTAGGSPLQPGEAATYSVARDAHQPWSTAVFPAGQARASRAELTLRNNAADVYAVKADPALAMSVQSTHPDCGVADAKHPGPHACRANSDYVVTFCAPPPPGQ